MRRTAAQASRDFIRADAFPKLGVRGLGREVEKRQARRLAATNAIFDLAAHGHERFSNIVTRLGVTHPAVVAYYAAEMRDREVLDECRRRYGNAVSHDAHWATFLATVR